MRVIDVTVAAVRLELSKQGTADTSTDENDPASEWLYSGFEVEEAQ